MRIAPQVVLIRHICVIRGAEGQSATHLRAEPRE